jgi:hypothetical protein
VNQRIVFGHLDVAPRNCLVIAQFDVGQALGLRRLPGRLAAARSIKRE